MADIFLAHSKQERELARRIGQMLEADGFSVWWDRAPSHGNSFDETILNEIDKSRVVIVLWSPAAALSAWVKAEASRALALDKFLPVLAKGDFKDIPLPFNQYQTLDLTNGQGEENAAEWIKLKEAIIRFLTSFYDHPAKIRKSFRQAKLDFRAESNRNLFIAHASYDKPRISPILGELIDAGFKLWIDKPHLLELPDEYILKIERIKIGSDWQKSIERAIHRSNAVLAFWSRDAIDAKRQQFHWEVYQGLIGKKLFQSKIDPIEESEIGMPYIFHQIADLSEFRPGSHSYQLSYLMEDIAEFDPQSR